MYPYYLVIRRILLINTFINKRMLFGWPNHSLLGAFHLRISAYSSGQQKVNVSFPYYDGSNVKTLPFSHRYNFRNMRACSAFLPSRDRLICRWDMTVMQ